MAIDPRAGNPTVRSFQISRRHFLRGAATAAEFAAFHPVGGAPCALSQVPPLPLPSASGIEHVLVVMMENRSFDHLLGWMDEADGRQAGLTYRDAAGAAHSTHSLAPDYQGCGHADPDHSYPAVDPVFRPSGTSRYSLLPARSKRT